MSEYRSKWMDWKSPHTPPYFTDRTDKRGGKGTSVSFVSATEGRFHTMAPLGEPTPDEPDCDDPIDGKRIVETAGDWRADDFRAFFEERAAIAEFDGELSRPDAESQAFECTVLEWMRRNPVAANKHKSCIFCLNEVEESEAITFLNGAEGQFLIHHNCYVGWMERRRGEADAALTAMGVRTSTLAV